MRGSEDLLTSKEELFSLELVTKLCGVYGREEECNEEVAGNIGIRNRSEDLGL
jgi:hypothetical protein